MDDHLAEIKADVKEIKGLVIQLVAQGAVHNEILSTHEKRSTNLEDRFEPIEKDYIFKSRLFTSILSTLGVVATLATIYKAFF